MKAAPARKTATKATGVAAAGAGPDSATPQTEEVASDRTDDALHAEQAVEPISAEPTTTLTAAAQTGADLGDPTESDPPLPESAETTRPEPAPGKPTPTSPTPAEASSTPPAPAEPTPLTGATSADGSEAGLAGRTPDLRMLVVRVLDHPGYAPELLALTAVEALGPGAAAWARRLRQRYPEADGDGLARLAGQRFVRQAGVGGATASLAGAFAPVVELAAVLWTQANLVLHLAAAYGRDPADPERAVELLVLAQVHPDEASARSALAAARAADGPGEQPGPRAAEAAWRLAAPLAAQAGGWLALRWASRVLPGAALVTAAVGDSAAAQRLASRAVAAYRPPRRR
ncbi:hypothetical protein ACIBO1_09850 [Micromonospora sp. NPDC049903]|uniref:hypothetical protein n=1 Tax=Micromonospora sp. NPDC049903 TaxID=3364276 RepID=UPI00379962C8